MTVEEKREGKNLTLYLKGRLDTAASPQLEEKLEECPAGVENLIFDFTEVEYISSAGLRILLAAHKRMKKAEGDIRVRGVNKEVREVFAITGFLEILTVE